MSVTRKFDAVIVGGGHNGLTCGAYLSRSGLRTLVLERRRVVGGTGAQCGKRNSEGLETAEEDSRFADRTRGRGVACVSDIDLNDQYEIESRVVDPPGVQARYVSMSVAAVELPGARLDVPYGTDARQRLDVFAPPRGPAPALMFFHGGYWRAGSKESRRFPAAAWRERGVAWVPVGYRLAPQATLDQIVADARDALVWLHRNALDIGCDPQRIHVAGNSAGGHLVGMLAADGWQDAAGVPRDVVKSAAAVSGLFDLAPLRRTFVDEWLRLSPESAGRNSPIHFPVRAGLPVLLAWGGRESTAFKQQSREYGRRCGGQVRSIECDEADHFSIIGDFGDSDSVLFQAIAAHVRARGL